MLFIPPILTLLIPTVHAWIPSTSTNIWIAEDAYYELASGHVVHEACRILGSHWWGVFGQTCSYVNNEGKIQYEYCAWIDGDLFECAFWGETPVRYGEIRAEGGTRGR